MPIGVWRRSTDGPEELYHKGEVDKTSATVETDQFMLVVTHTGVMWDAEPGLSPTLSLGDSSPQKLSLRVRELKNHRLSTLRKCLRRHEHGQLGRHWNHDKLCVCGGWRFATRQDPEDVRSHILDLIDRLTHQPPVCRPIRKGEELHLELPSVRSIPAGTVKSWRLHNH